MSELTLHNRDVRDLYYKNFTGHISTARCNSALRRGAWEQAFENALYHTTPEKRQDALFVIVNLNMRDVVDYIFENRRTFRDSDISLTGFPICRWMKEKAPHSYSEMKNLIKKFLSDAASSGSYTETQLKDTIVGYFVYFLENNFIWL